MRLTIVNTPRKLPEFIFPPILPHIIQLFLRNLTLNFAGELWEADFYVLLVVKPWAGWCVTAPQRQQAGVSQHAEDIPRSGNTARGSPGPGPRCEPSPPVPGRA